MAFVLSQRDIPEGGKETGREREGGRTHAANESETEYAVCNVIRIESELERKSALLIQ